jgi:hypothetical protein
VQPRTISGDDDPFCVGWMPPSPTRDTLRLSISTEPMVRVPWTPQLKPAPLNEPPPETNSARLNTAQEGSRTWRSSPWNRAMFGSSIVTPLPPESGDKSTCACSQRRFV